VGGGDGGLWLSLNYMSHKEQCHVLQLPYYIVLKLTHSAECDM